LYHFLLSNFFRRGGQFWNPFGLSRRCLVKAFNRNIAAG
jgi:hypothetical protein